MKVSFLVTYYNQEQYVRQSMDSIIAINKPSEWEILVGDDGSSDETVNIVSEYISRYPENIKLYIMPRDKNLQYDSVKRASANRINLLEHCTGDCFCTLDGDDFFCDREFIKTAISVFDENPDISLVSFGYRYYRDGNLEEERLLPAGISDRVDTKYYIRNLYLHAGACVHRILWDESRVRYIKEIGYFDDNDIVINSLNYGQMYHVRQSIYAYRQTGESVYTSMSAIEQALLNVLGFDVDKQLIDSKYYNDLCIRNSESILTVFLYRRRISELLGERKFEIYRNNSAIIMDSLCASLINYKTIDRKEKKIVKHIISRILFKKKGNLKIIMKFFLGGSK